MKTRLLTVTAMMTLVVSACGGAPSAGEPTSTTVGPATTTTSPTATTVPSSDEVLEIRHRTLVDGLDGGGRPWTTGRVISDEELATLAPDTTVDWESEVVFRFTLAESGSCPFDEMQGLAFSQPALRMYPVVPLVGEPEACTDDANPHSIVVAVEKADLPSGEFSIWVNGEEVPSSVTDGVTRFAAGELTASEGEPPALDSSGAIAVGETRLAHGVTAHCGLDRIFRPIDGRQWVLEDYEGDEIDYIPPSWESALTGEQVDLLIERAEADRLLVTPMGTDAELAYVPAADEVGCD